MRPSLTDPSEHVLDTVENILRRALPAYGLTTPAWAPDTTCPAGHWFLPEGASFHRYDVPSETVVPAVLLGLEGKSTPRHPHDSRYWDVPIIMQAVWHRDLPATVWRAMRERLHGLFVNGIRQANGTRIPSRTVLSQGATHVFAIKDFEADRVQITEGNPSFILRGTLFCTGLPTPLTPDGDLFTTPDGFTLTIA